MPSLFELALAYTQAGISIIPILPNEALAPNGCKSTPFDCREYIRHRIAAQKNSVSGFQMIDGSAWRRCMAPSAEGWNVWI